MLGDRMMQLASKGRSQSLVLTVACVVGVRPSPTCGSDGLSRGASATSLAGDTAPSAASIIALIASGAADDKLVHAIFLCSYAEGLALHVAKELEVDTGGGIEAELKIAILGACGGSAAATADFAPSRTAA